MDDKKRMRIAEISLVVTAASFALGSILDLMEFQEKYPKRADEALIFAIVTVSYTNLTLPTIA